MVNIIITSEMRVGSRWLHYLLSELLHMKVSPELDVSTLPKSASIVKFRFKDNTIVKFHHALPSDIFSAIPTKDCVVIAVVRNPRDRIVSWTFHQRFKPQGQGWLPLKNAKTDEEAVKTAFYSHFRTDADKNQEILMQPKFSTKFVEGKKAVGSYIWTSYHWLKNNLFREIKTIVRYLGLNIKDSEIKRVCLKHSFQRRAGRAPGEEVRTNEWFRKGEEGDWENWFDEKMVAESADSDKKYWDAIKSEEGNT